MTKRYLNVIVLMAAAVSIAACVSAPTPAATLTPVAPTIPLPTATLPPTEEVEIDTNRDNAIVMENNMNIKIGDHILTATLVENSSVDALKAALAAGSLTRNMRDYGSMEKVGSLGMDLPRNDPQITTEAGDIILYQGSALVIYYAPNS